MADLKITSLPALAEAGIQATDVLALADISATETKKVTVKDIVAAAAQFLDAGDIPAAKVGTLGTNQVATGAIQDGAVTNVKLANSSISLGGVSIALGATDATPAFNLADATGYLTTNLVGTITNAQLAGSIAGTKLLDTTIAYAKLNISDGDIPGAKIATGGITATQLAANSVTASELADDAVDTAAIADGAVVAASIATDTITANQIAANAIGASELADNSVDAGAIASNAVTTIKILDANVTAAKLAANLPGSILATGAISSTQLAADSVTASELANNAVDSGAIAASAVTDAKIASGIGGAKITDGTITAAKLATANIDRSLNVASGNLGINNTVTAATRSGITYNAQGLITGTVALAASDLPVATASAVGGVSVGTGLAVTGAGALSLSNSVTAATVSGITYNAQGQITATTALVAGDLPVATTSAKGAVQITSGGGLTVDGSGNLTTSTSGVSAGTYQSVTVNNKGVITAGAALTAGLIPDLAASKITSGSLDAARIGTSTISGTKLADSSVCKFTGATSTSGIVTFPTAEFKGQFFYDLTNDDLYVYDGSAFQPVTITSGEIIYAGNYRADTNKVTTLTAAGTAQGFTVGAALQASSEANNRYYFVCDKSGTGTSPAPTVTINPPDMILSNGTSWEKLDISNFIAGQVASNISVTAVGGIQNTNVQSALEELDTEKLNLTGGTITGALLIGHTGSLVFEGSSNDDYELTLAVANPQGSDKTLTLPDVTGTIITTGDTGTVTSTMLADGTIVNADVNASAAIALTKLAAVSAGQILVGASGTGVITAVGVTGDISINAAGLVSITADSIVNADIKSDAQIAGSKIVSGTTSVVGVVQLEDSVSSASTTKAATPASVKTVNDALTTTTATANAALPTTGGTLTNNLIIDNAKQIRFTEADANGANYVSLQAPDTLAADTSYTLPSALPTANGQVLASTTGGVLSWTEDPTGGWVTSGDNISYSAGDVTFTGASYNLVWDKSDSALEFADNAKAVFGSQSDLKIWHDGTKSLISNATGDLYINNNADTIIKPANDCFIKPQDGENGISVIGNGAVELFYDNVKKLETTSGGISTTGSLYFGTNGGISILDSGKVKLGDHDDLQIYHNGTDAYIDNSTGVLKIRHGTDLGIVQRNNGSVELYYDGSKKLETTSGGISVAGDVVGEALTATNGNAINLADNKKINLGSSSDLQLYYDGGDGFIKLASGVGGIRLESDQTLLRSADSSETYISTVKNGAVELYYDNVKTFETEDNGAYIYGPEGGIAQLMLYADEGDDNPDKWRMAASASASQFNLYNFNDGAWETSIECNGSGAVELYYDNVKRLQTYTSGVEITGNLALGDNKYALFGSSSDLQIYHDGSNSKIDNSTGKLLINTSANLFGVLHGSDDAIISRVNGAVELYYDNSKTFQTTSYGAEVIGTFRCDALSLLDNEKIQLGSSGSDLEIYHDGNNSYIKDAGTGDLFIRNGTDDAIRCRTDGAVDLFYDNVKKFETLTDGTMSHGHIFMPGDAYRLKIGGSYDLQIYHNGSHSYIDNSTNQINIRSSGGIYFRNTGGSEKYAAFVTNGQVELYYDNSKKLETYSAGNISHGTFRPAADDTSLLGTGGYRWDAVYSANGTIQTSDRNEKNTILQSDLGLSFIDQLKPVSYKFNNKDKTHYGLIAQDLEEVLKKEGKTLDDFAGIVKDEKYGLNYSELISPLVKAVQELSAKVAALEAG